MTVVIRWQEIARVVLRAVGDTLKILGEVFARFRPTLSEAAFPPRYVLLQPAFLQVTLPFPSVGVLSATKGATITFEFDSGLVGRYATPTPTPNPTPAPRQRSGSLTPPCPR